MPYYNVAKLLTVTKTNMIDEMPCGFGTLGTTTVRIWHQVSRRFKQRFQPFQNFTIIYVQYQSTGECSCRVGKHFAKLHGVWEHLEVFRSTGEGYQSFWEVGVWLPNQFTFSWCSSGVIIGPTHDTRRIDTATESGSRRCKLCGLCQLLVFNFRSDQVRRWWFR